MSKYSLRTACLLLVLFSIQAIGQTKMDQLLVYGDNFSFFVTEPKGWKADIENSKEYKANVLFYLQSETPENAAALIRILNFKKTDENTDQDMASDMKQYQSKYSNIKFKDINIEHPSYKTSSKLFYVPGDFYEYVVYINPGKEFKDDVQSLVEIL